MDLELAAAYAGENYSPELATGIGAIEQQIIAQLQASGAQSGNALGQVEIAHFPDKPEHYRLVHRVGAALVVFAGAKYGNAIATRPTIQERRLEFRVRILARDLGWAYGGPAGGPSPGAYALIDAVRWALLGFQPAGCTHMESRGDAFLERDSQGGVWIYECRFETTTMVIEVTPATTYPNFTDGVMDVALNDTATSNPVEAQEGGGASPTSPHN